MNTHTFFPRSFSLTPFLLLFSILCACLAACGDDDKYDSVPPAFSSLTFQNLTRGDSTLRVGDTLVATAVQERHGRLLNRTSYTWTTSDADARHKFQGNVVYDHAPGDPTDTIVFSRPGACRLTFTALYNASGQVVAQRSDRNIDAGTITTVSEGTLRYKVTLVKTLRIRP